MRNKISVIKFLTVFVLACFFVSGVAGPSWGEDIEENKIDKGFLGIYGGDIDKALENYDSYYQNRLVDLNIDTNMPSELHCGEQYDLWIKVTGNYEDKKGNSYKRNVLNPETLVDASSFVIEKQEKQENGITLRLSAPTTEGESEIKTKVSYKDKIFENIYRVKIIKRPSWAEKQYIALYGGSLGMFGIEANVASNFIDFLNERGVLMFFNGSLYFRKKGVNSDTYIMATELGTKMFTEKMLDRIYLFGGINIGYDTEGRSFESPTEGESKFYTAPNIGFKYLFWQYAVISQIEWVVYGDSSVALFKLGIGI